MRLSIVLCLLLPLPVLAEPNLGCSELKHFAALGWLSGDRETNRSMDLARETLCSGNVVEGAPLFYPNGQVLSESVNKPGTPLYYDNGRLIMGYLGEGWTPWYYPDGSVISSAGGEYGARWFYPNGAFACAAAQLPGNKWFYPDGALLTSSSGTVGAWYYRNGRLISPTFGLEGSTWYREDGSVLRVDGPALTASQLWLPVSLLRELALVDPQQPKP